MGSSVSSRGWMSGAGVSVLPPSTALSNRGLRHWGLCWGEGRCWDWKGPLQLGPLLLHLVPQKQTQCPQTCKPLRGFGIRILQYLGFLKPLSSRARRSLTQIVSRIQHAALYPCPLPP